MEDGPPVGWGSEKIRGMKKTSRVSVTEQPLPFQWDPEPATEILTGFGGLPMVVQTFRSMRLPEAIREHVRIKERQRGYDESTFVESFVVLNAAGGGRLSIKLCLRGESSSLLKARLKHGIELSESCSDSSGDGSPSTVLQG